MARTTIVALGDSTTAGTPRFLSPIEAPPSGRGDPESQYCHWMMKTHPEWKVLNRGVNGQRSDQILSRFDRDVLKEGPEVVIVLAGVNDIYQGRTAEFVERNLESMYGLAEKSDIVPLGATILPYNTAGQRESETILKVNSWVGTACGTPKRLFCDTNSAVRDPSDPSRLASSPDGLHPDVDGYRNMGAALSRVLEDAGY